MSSKLDELQQQHEELLTKAKLIEDQLQAEQIKELKREQSPIRYDADTGVFTVKVTDPEVDTGYYEIELTLTENQFDNLYQTITTQKIKGLLTDFPYELGGGFKRSPFPHDSFPELGTKLLRDTGLGAAINGLFRQQ